MKNKLGIVLMLVGVIMTLAAGGLFLYNQVEDEEAGEQAEIMLSKVEDKIQEIRAEKVPQGMNLPSNEMKVQTIDGKGYIGYLSIPSLGKKLPVLSEWNKQLLNIAPCRYYGSDRTENLVIAAHNYRRHFGRLYKMSPGDQVIFTNMDGVVTEYEVIEADIMSGTDIEEMTSGEFDLTLFTCTYGGKKRIAIRCDRNMKTGL